MSNSYSPPHGWSRASAAEWLCVLVKGVVCLTSKWGREMSGAMRDGDWEAALCWVGRAASLRRERARQCCLDDVLEATKAFTKAFYLRSPCGVEPHSVGERDRSR